MSTISSTKEAMAAARTRMEKAVEDFRKELATIRTGRANASILDNVRVDYHGAPMAVNQLGTVTVPDATMIVIAPWDTSAVVMIDKAIRTSDLGLNPTNDGKVVRVPVPSPTEERRKELVKQLHKKVEEGRVELRTLRRHAHDEMRAKEKSAGITTDEVKRAEAQLQKLTDRYILMADEIGSAKEKEILAV